MKARPVMVEVERMLSTTPLCAPVDPALAGSERAVHRAVQGRRENRVRRAKRQMLGLRDEGRGGIVDQHVERRLAPDRVHHGIDRGAVANVASDDADLAAEIVAHLRRRRLQQFEPAAADDQFGAELDEAASHRSTEPGTAAGDQDAFFRQQAFFEHRLILLLVTAVIPDRRVAQDPESRGRDPICGKRFRVRADARPGMTAFQWRPSIVARLQIRHEASSLLCASETQVCP